MNKILVKHKNFFLLKKKLKILLVVVVIDVEGNFKLSSKLSLFELDKLTIFIKKFFEKIILSSFYCYFYFSTEWNF
jgi:hypothetical protein